jgi:hypothetical protein
VNCWHGGDGVDGVEVVERVGEGVGLVELEGVVRLGFDVDADHLEASEVIAVRSAARLAEQVEDPHSWAAFQSATHVSTVAT